MRPIRSVSWVLAIAAVVVAAVVLAFRTRGPDGPARPPAGATRIRVLDPAGRPVAGAAVEVYGTDPDRPEPRRLSAAVTDAAGLAYAPASPEPRVARIVARGLAGTALDLDGDAVETTLGPGRVEAGLVVDLLGRPLPNARLTSPARPPFVAEAVSGEDGLFALGPLAPDAWIRAEHAGHAPLEVNLATYPVGLEWVVLPLAPGSTVEGMVTTADGRPVPGAVVTLDQECVSRVVAGGDGRFRVPGVLSNWEVILAPRAPGLVGETETALAGARDVRLRLHRPASLRGRVVVEGAEGPLPEGWEVSSPGGAPVVRDGGGGFRFEGLRPGRFRIEARADFLSGDASLDLGEGEIREGVTVVLRPPRWGLDRDDDRGRPIRIRVVDAESGGPAASALVRWDARGPGERGVRTDGLGEAVVVLPPGRHRLTLGGRLEPLAPTDVEVDVPGTSGIEAVLRRNPVVRVEVLGAGAPGESRLTLRSGDPGPIREIVFGGREVTFPAAPDAPLDLALRAPGFLPARLDGVRVPAAGTVAMELRPGPLVSGRCLGAGGHPLPRVVAEMDGLPEGTRLDPVYHHAETPGDGRFDVGPLEPGAYRLLVYARNVRARRFDLAVGDASIDLGDVAMAPPADLVVDVRTSAGDPVPGALVESTSLIASKALTDERGRVVLPGTSESDVLRVRADGLRETWRDVAVPADRGRVEVEVRLVRPVRLLLRTVDREGRPAVARLPEGAVRRAGEGELLYEDLPPGPFEIDLEDGRDRRGTLRTVLREGEFRVETVVLE